MESEAKAASGAVPPVDAPAAVTAQSPAVASGSKGAPKEKKEKAEKAGPPQPKGDKKEKPAKPGAGASAAGAKAGGKDSKKAGAAGAGKPKAEVKVADGFRHIPVSVHDKDAPVADLTPPADLHDSFVALAASLTSTVGVEGSVYAAALLKASIQAIGDYNRPENKVFSWDLNASLSKAFEYLSSSVRPFLPAVAAAARNIKAAVARVSPTLSDSEAKAAVIGDLNAYLKERTSVVQDGLVADASCRVVTSATPLPSSDGLTVAAGDVLLTFGYSSAVETLLKSLHAKLAKEQAGALFTVAIVDARPLLGGQTMLQSLSAAGIPCIYGHLSALPRMIKRCKAVVLGAEAVGSDGSVLSQAGTALVASAARQAGLAVHVLCESYKFAERAFLDAATGGSANEMLPSVCVSSELTTKAPEVPAAAPLMTAVAARAKAAATAAGVAAPAAPAKPKQQQQQKAGGGGGDKDAIQTCASSGRFEHDAALPLAGELASLPAFASSAASSSPSSAGSSNSPLHTSVIAAASSLSAQANPAFNSAMGNWRRKPGLKVMALAMDVTPPSDVTSILTEAGAVPPSAVWVIQSEFGKLEEAPEEEGEGNDEDAEEDDGEEAGEAEDDDAGGAAGGDEAADDEGAEA